MLVWLLRSLLFGWCGECFGVLGFVVVALPLLLVVMLLPLVVLRFGVALLVERAVPAHGKVDYRPENVLSFGALCHSKLKPHFVFILFFRKKPNAFTGFLDAVVKAHYCWKGVNLSHYFNEKAVPPIIKKGI